MAKKTKQLCYLTFIRRHRGESSLPDKSSKVDNTNIINLKEIPDEKPTDGYYSTDGKSSDSCQWLLFHVVYIVIKYGST